MFTKAKRSQVVSRIRGRGNKDTKLTLVTVRRRQGVAVAAAHSAGVES